MNNNDVFALYEKQNNAQVAAQYGAATATPGGANSQAWILTSKPLKIPPAMAAAINPAGDAKLAAAGFQVALEALKTRFHRSART